MTSREIFRDALGHKPGSVPVDFGSSAPCGMHISIVAALRNHFGLENRPVKVIEPYQMLGEIDGELREIIGVDVTGVYPRDTMFGFPLENWKEWRTPWGQVVLIPGRFNTTTEGEDTLIYPEGDLSSPPSGRMPGGGNFFDAIIRQPPLDEDNLNAEDNLEEYRPVSEEDLAYYENECRRAEKSGQGIIAVFGGTAIGDIAMVPATQLKHPKGIRDITDWYMATMLHTDLLHEIFEKQTDIALANLAKIHDRVGDIPDVAYICGTDFGTQDSQFCSVETFRELYAPYYRRINGWIHGNTGWKTFKHSCGAVRPFLPEFIDVGFDIINPVQVSAADMDARELKNEFGDNLVFWGGGVDTQQTLPFDTPGEVRRQVTERLEIFSKNGGYVFNAIHNIQAGTPVENVVAMFDAVAEYRSK